MEIIKELLMFLKYRKKLWMAPLLIIMLAVGGLLTLVEGTVFAPFIYTLF
tara:strand:- start:207 stop:356 length:150 start_codon:yes stop_codon:yes gene_type:complete